MRKPYAIRETRALTPRQKQVVALVAGGLSNPEIARELGVKRGTVKNYMALIFDKLGLDNRVEVALWATRR
jgi:DNA-binding NarL/FixJ family response regulator